MEVVADEKPAVQPQSAVLKWTVAAIAVAMSLYHMHVAAFGPNPPNPRYKNFVFKGSHPEKKGQSGEKRQ